MRDENGMNEGYLPLPDSFVEEDYEAGNFI